MACLLPPGAKIDVLGRNGSGKSALLQVMATLDEMLATTPPRPDNSSSRSNAPSRRPAAAKVSRIGLALGGG
ncbi:MAG: ATP-binding cassette domain-containing protein [Planctomycetes bacterium]|nr:ATP-binding cassette domain-containing protein [Planctomycetota bacterium]